MAGREKKSLVRLILKNMTFNWTQLCDLTVCKVYISIKQAGANNIILLSNDGVMNLDYTHSVQDLIIERQHSREIQSKSRILWPKGN